MATRAELFASGELKSPLNVKEKVIKTLRDAAEEGGGGGGGLPSVSGTDNGKVLTVVEGSWAAANPSGGGGGVIKMTMTPVEGTNSFTLDKTYADISAALQGGSLCYTIHYDGEEGPYGVLFAVFYGESEDPETEATIYYVTVSDVRGYTQISFNSSTVDGTLIGSIQG